jgi:hypothetical protein
VKNSSKAALTPFILTGFKDPMHSVILIKLTLEKPKLVSQGIYFLGVL